MLAASIQEMRKACLKNAKAAAALQGAHANCQRVLNFYSAESGLKAVVMNDRGEKTSESVGQQFGHNIRTLIAAAKISAAELNLKAKSKVELPVVKRQNGNEVSFSELHTAWRYDIVLEQAGANAAAATLENLVAALRVRLTT